MSDVRALLLTDVVDSTRLWEELGNEATAAAWTAHDRLARDLLPLWRGREIDKTDGLLLLFDSATDAVGYALAYHQALETLRVPLKARAGLHLGPVLLRENSAPDVARGAKPLEVDGIAKPTVARVMSLAQGGQTLLSSPARDALGDSGYRIESHGHWRLKGVAEPMELFEVMAAASVPAPPADSDKAYRVVRTGDVWLPLRQIAHNLPEQPTSFVGRAREVAELRGLLGSVRLLTLLGIGGLGKTRLALQVAAGVMYEYPDGVWFVDLAPIRDPSLVVSETAKLLGVQEELATPLIQTLCLHLKRRKVLLILDNCEHLVRAAGNLAHAVLQVAPQVRIVVTTREALRIPGEQLYPVAPLAFPTAAVALNALSASSAVRLFVDRARQRRPGFELTEQNAGAIAAIVARLEGIPLALELAAARVPSLSLAEINARLADRYRLLTGGGKVLLARQQSLRALVDWSYDLLDESERVALNRASVFVGGFDLSAAEAVCGAQASESADVLDLLSELVDKSLVLVESSEDDTRYRMLETIRDYAREKLESSGELAATAARHCNHFFAMAKAANVGMRSGGQQPKWIRRVEADIDNIRAAINLALAGGVDQVIAIKIIVAMQGFWLLRGYGTEGRNYVQTALKLPAVSASDIARAHALYVGAALASVQGDNSEARLMLDECLALRRGMGDLKNIAGTLSTIANVRLASGDEAGASAGEEEALAIFRGLGDRFGEAISLLHLGQIQAASEMDEEARGFFNECLELSRTIGNLEVEAECELMLGTLAFYNGLVEDAALRFAGSLEICRRSGNRSGEATALWWSSRVDMARGDVDAASEGFEVALEIFQTFGMTEAILGCLEDLAAVRHQQGETANAVRLCALAHQARSRTGVVLPSRAQKRLQAERESMRSKLGSDTFEQVWMEGRQLPIQEGVRVAMMTGDKVR